MKWYVLFVKPGNELITQKWLRLLLASTFYCIVPRRKLLEKKMNSFNETTKIIFPGYLFIKIDMCIDIYYCLKKIPYLIKILNYDSYYTEIPENEINTLLKLISENEIIDFSIASLVDSKLVIISGPLKNNESLIKKINKRKKRATVSLRVLGEEKQIDLGIKVL